MFSSLEENPKVGSCKTRAVINIYVEIKKPLDLDEIMFVYCLQQATGVGRLLYESVRGVQKQTNSAAEKVCYFEVHCLSTFTNIFFGEILNDTYTVYC